MVKASCMASRLEPAHAGVKAKRLPQISGEQLQATPATCKQNY